MTIDIALIKQHYKILLLLLCGALLAGAIALYYVQRTSSIEIVLTDEGFSPNTVTIFEGETVTFKNNRTEAFWPASNVHPTHTNYPDFDPRKPLPAGATWSYTFTKAGRYGFHDHIVSLYEGEVIVTKKDGTAVEVDCSVEKTQQCWEKLILETLKVEGVKSAFDTIVRLSETEPAFGSDCHGLSHLIGEKAYAQYTAKENFELTPATSLCGYGFYHGFMETMTLATGDIAQGREFCELVDKQLSGQASAAATACYHGIGHGTIDGSDPTAWGNAEKMMAPGFTLCEAMSKNELERYLCDTGVLNAIEILSKDTKYGLSELREDSFLMCNRQPVFRREGCYANMMPIIFENFDNDFQKVFDYVNSRMIDAEVTAIDGNTVNDLTIIGIMFEWIRLFGDEDDHMEKGVAFCRAQDTDDRLPCIAGLSGGYIKYGEPGREYIKNLEFCAVPSLTQDERESCYGYTLPRMSGRYTPADTQMICDLVPTEFSEKYCPS